MWKKYPKMENLNSSYKESYCADPDIEWVALEKIHGSNLSVHVTGINKFEFYRRNGKIDLEENFYKYKNTFKLLEGMLNECFKVLNNQFILYGEQFGGQYNHPDIENMTDKPVQKEIHYSPNFNFIPFDLRIWDKTRSNWYFEDYCVFNNLMKSIGFKTPPILCKGCVTKVCNYDVNNNIITKIPELYNLPPILDNFIEGVVIRPIKNIYHKKDRVMYKNKTIKFSEKLYKVKKVPSKLEPIIKEFMSRISPYVTIQRLHNVLSKEPEEFNGDKYLGETIKKFLADIYEDVLLSDDANFYRTFKKNKKDIVSKGNKLITREIVSVIKQNKLNRLKN